MWLDVDQEMVVIVLVQSSPESRVQVLQQPVFDALVEIGCLTYESEFRCASFVIRELFYMCGPYQNSLRPNCMMG